MSLNDLNSESRNMISKLINVKNSAQAALAERGRVSFIKNINIFAKEDSEIKFSIIIQEGTEQEEFILAKVSLTQDETKQVCNNIAIPAASDLIVEVVGDVSINVSYIEM